MGDKIYFPNLTPNDNRTSLDTKTRPVFKLKRENDKSVKTRSIDFGSVSKPVDKPKKELVIGNNTSIDLHDDYSSLPPKRKYV